MTVSMGLEHDVWCVATSVSLVNTGGLWVTQTHEFLHPIRP
jgi:hypothetical protein